MRDNNYFELFPFFFDVQGNLHRVDVPAPWLSNTVRALSDAASIESAWLSVANKIASMSIDAYQEAHPECVMTLDDLDNYKNEQQ